MKKVLTFLVSLFLCVGAFSAPSAALFVAASVAAATSSRNNESAEHNRQYHNSTLEPQKVFIGQTVVKDSSTGEYDLVDVYENRVYYSCGEHLESQEEMEAFVRSASKEEIDKYESHRLKLILICGVVIFIVILVTILLVYSEVYNDS